jgi:hypothetical protein
MTDCERGSTLDNGLKRMILGESMVRRVYIMKGFQNTLAAVEIRFNYFSGLFLSKSYFHCSSLYH